MRERAGQIGAKLNIWSGVGAGTEIELSIAGSIAYGDTSPGRSRLRLFRREGRMSRDSSSRGGRSSLLREGIAALIASQSDMELVARSLQRA